MYALCPKMTLQVLVQNAATCVSAVGKAGGKAAFNATALGASARAGARFASITSAHLSRQQPKLSMST